MLADRIYLIADSNYYLSMTDLFDTVNQSHLDSVSYVYLGFISEAFFVFSGTLIPLFSTLKNRCWLKESKIEIKRGLSPWTDFISYLFSV